MRVIFAALVVLTAVAVFSGYEIVAAVKLKKNDTEFSKLEGMHFEKQ